MKKIILSLIKTINLSITIFLKDKFTSQIKKASLLCAVLLCCNTISAQDSKAPWLEGSWGVRLIMQAGSLLDNALDNLNYDYVEYAKQINLNYPTAGHVITNFNGNANGTLFTLRQNDNVDIAAIDPTMVPSLANEQAIFDVINELKTGGKRVLLYMNFTPNMFKGTDSQRANWDTYVDANFSGDYMNAYNNLMEGFVKRFKGLIDGYWIDNFAYGTDEDKDSFVQMVRNTDPNAILCVNYRKSYFTGIEVDSDGVDDTNDTNYNVIKFQANDIWSDYTGGHVTPLGQGAPPNSWAYDEFTVPDMEANNLSSVTIGGVSNNNVLKHMFTPIRERWTSSALPIKYDKDQAYRMIKRITDAGGAFTFSTTTSSTGLPMPDEVAILTHVNDQLSIDADYVPYERPVCAYLVSEGPPADTSVCTTDTGGGDSSNLALNRTATQSTTLNGAEASRAVDGDTDGVFSRGSVTAAQGPNAWWQVELDESYSINTINVFNRTNCCEERLADFTVSVINSDGLTVFEETITTIPDPSVTIDAGGAAGNIVRIDSNLTLTLNLAEVEVFGNTLGIDDNNKNDRLRIYPNPVSNIINIDFKSSETARLEITDYLGKTIRSSTVENGSKAIDVSNLTSGLYFIKVSDQYGTFSSKIIKK